MANAGDIEKVVLGLGLDPKALRDVKSLVKGYKDLEEISRKVKSNIADLSQEKGKPLRSNAGGKNQTQAMGMGNPETAKLIRAQNSQINTLIGEFKKQLGTFAESAKTNTPARASKIRQAAEVFNERLKTGPAQLAESKALSAKRKRELKTVRDARAKELLDERNHRKKLTKNRLEEMDESAQKDRLAQSKISKKRQQEMDVSAQKDRLAQSNNSKKRREELDVSAQKDRHAVSKITRKRTEEMDESAQKDRLAQSKISKKRTEETDLGARNTAIANAKVHQSRIETTDIGNRNKDIADAKIHQSRIESNDKALHDKRVAENTLTRKRLENTDENTHKIESARIRRERRLTSKRTQETDVATYDKAGSEKNILRNRMIASDMDNHKADVKAWKARRKVTEELAITENNQRKALLKQQESTRNSASRQRASAVDANPVSNRDTASRFRAGLQNDRNKSLIRRNEDGGAGLLRNQATLLQNYAILGGAVGAGYSAGSFVLELDKSFKQLQSIVALTNTEMKELSVSIIDISEKTKFTAVEVAEAAIVLGQAGFGKDQISSALEGVTLFATAVGTDLKSAVDLATSTLGVYNKSATQMPQIVDKMTVAINNSKLNMDKLSLGLQYAGNIAAQSNVSFEETVSALSAMANSGIRSGSTLGTGLRQILIALQKPSEGLKNVLSNLGITMDKIDLKTHGLIGVMKNLAEGGFTVTDAMRTMQVRAGAAFSAFVNNIDVAEDIATQMEIGGAAAKANAVQMEALTNQWARFSAIYKSIFYLSFEPVLESLTSMVTVLGDLGQSIKSLGPLLPILGTFAAMSLTIGMGRRIGKLGAGLLKDGRVLSKFKDLAAAAGLATAGTSLIGGANTKGRPYGYRKATQSEPNIVRRPKPFVGLDRSAPPKGFLKMAGSVALGLLGGSAGLIAAAVLAVAAGGYFYIKNQRDSQGIDKAQADLNTTNSERERQQASDKKLDEVRLKMLTRERVLTVNSAQMKSIDDDSSLTNEEKSNKKQALLESTQEKLSNQLKELNDELGGLGFFVSETSTSFQSALVSLEKFKEKTLKKIVELSPQLVKETVTLTNAAVSASFQSNDQLSQLVNGQLPRTTSVQGIVANRLGGTRQAVAGTENLEKLLGPGGNFEELSATFTDLAQRFTDIDPTQANAQTFYANLEDEYREINAFLNRLNTFGPTSTKENAPVFAAFIEEVGKKINLTQTSQISAKSIADNTPGVDGETRASRDIKIRNEIEAEIGIALVRRRTELDGQLAEMLQRSRNSKDLDTSLAVYTEIGELRKTIDLEIKQARGNLEALLKDYDIPLNSLQGQKFSNQSIEGNFAGLDKATLEAQQEVSPDAKIVYDRETKSALDDFKARLKQLNSKKSDTANSGEINQLHEMMLIVMEDKKELELEASVAFGDEGVRSGPERIKKLKKHSDSKFKSDSSKLQQETDRQLEFSRILDELNAGTFSGVVDFSKSSDRVLSRALRRFIVDKLLQINNTFEEAQNKLIDEDMKFVDLQRKITLSQRFTQDTGVDARLRGRALVGEGQDQRNAVINRQGRATADIDSLDVSSSAIRKEILGLTKGVNDLTAITNPETKIAIKAAQSRIIENDSKRAELEVKLSELGIELKDVDFNNQTAILQTSRERSSFMSDRQLQINAFTSGSGYTTAAGTQVSAQSTNTGGMFEGVANGGMFALDDISAHYEGYNALGEAVEALTIQGKAMGDSFGDAFFQFASGAQTAGDAARGFLLGFLADLGNTASKIAANQLMTMLIQSATSFFAPNLGGLNTDGGSNITNIGAGAARAYQGRHQTAGSYGSKGLITSGNTSRDSTLINAAKGEFVLRRAAVQALGIDSVRALNSMDPNNVTKSTQGLQGLAMPKDSGSGSGNKLVNVYVVSPEAKPQSTNRNDVIAIISDDMLRNGQTKKLIKQINMGAL